MVLLLSDERKFKFKICAVATFLDPRTCSLYNAICGAGTCVHGTIPFVLACSVVCSSQSEASPGPLVQ